MKPTEKTYTHTSYSDKPLQPKPKLVAKIIKAKQDVGLDSTIFPSNINVPIIRNDINQILTPQVETLGRLSESNPNIPQWQQEKALKA